MYGVSCTSSQTLKGPYGGSNAEGDLAESTDKVDFEEGKVTEASKKKAVEEQVCDVNNLFEIIKIG